MSISDLLAYFLDERDKEERSGEAPGPGNGAAPASNGGGNVAPAAPAPAPSAQGQGAGAAAASDVVVESGDGGRDGAREPPDHRPGDVAAESAHGDGDHSSCSGADKAGERARRSPPAEPPGDGGDVYEVEAEHR